MSKALSEDDQLIWSKLPSVSVIVLNYNTREHLEDCFRSLQQLTYPDDRLELILVDNASTDQSVEYVRTNFTEVKLISNDKNYGFSQGNNIGAKSAQGDFIAFLNPDMRVDERWLIESIKLLLEDSEIAAVGSTILSWDGKSIDFAGGAANFYGYGYQLGFGNTVNDNFGQAEPILFACGGAMVIHHQVFLNVGGFDEDFFAYYEDLDLGWRLWVLGYKVILAPASITYHIHHGSWKKVEEQKRQVLYERNAFFTMLKNYDDINLNKILPVALLLLLKRVYLAAGIDEQPFRFGTKPQIEETSSASASARVQNAPLVYNRSYYFKEAWRTLTTEGIYALYLKFKSELKRRARVRVREKLPGQMQMDKNLPQRAIVPMQALSYIVAGNDIIALYEKMLKKRDLIQAHRRRSDKEILGLFKKPLGFSELWSEYKQTQTYLTGLFGIDKIFEDQT